MMEPGRSKKRRNFSRYKTSHFNYNLSGDIGAIDALLPRVIGCVDLELPLHSKGDGLQK